MPAKNTRPPETGPGRNPLRQLPHAERTIPALLEKQAARYGSKILLRAGDVRRTYEEMPEAVGRTAAALADLSVGRGDRVAVLSHNRAEMLELFLACAWMGAIFVPLNTAFRGVQLGHQLRVSGSSVLVDRRVTRRTEIRKDGPRGRRLQLRVVDEPDLELPAGEPGELVVRHTDPDSIATGYWQNPEATVEAWRNLWFHTGDRVSRDREGYFTYMDQIKDSIRRRGENISSYEVKQALNSHTDVVESVVVAVPSELSEDEVKACVVLRPGAKLGPLEIVRWCEPRLAYFSVPRYVELLPELPHTPNGKVQKYALRDRGTKQAFDREAAGYKVQR